MARWQQLSTASKRLVLRTGGRDLHDEHHYLRRFGDGATLDGLASRGLFALSRLADSVHRAGDALGFFTFRKPD